MTAEGSQDEQELTRRFRDGDEEAFRLLFGQCEDVLQARIRSLMSKALRRRISIADVLQETRMVAFQRRLDLEFRGPGSFRNWLLGIVDLRARHLVRQHAGAAMRSVDNEVTRGCRPDTAGYPGKAPSPSQDAIGSELKELALQAMNALSDDYHKVLHLTSVEHLSFDEIAKRMGRSRDAVRKLHGRALMAFTEIFKRLRGEDHE